MMKIIHQHELKLILKRFALSAYLTLLTNKPTSRKFASLKGGQFQQVVLINDLCPRSSDAHRIAMSRSPKHIPLRSSSNSIPKRITFPAIFQTFCHNLRRFWTYFRSTDTQSWRSVPKPSPRIFDPNTITHRDSSTSQHLVMSRVYSRR